MKNSFSTRTSANRIFEDRIYEQIGQEIANGKMDTAAQTRAIQEGGDDDGEVKKAYIKHRFSSLQSEQRSLHQIMAQKRSEDVEKNGLELDQVDEHEEQLRGDRKFGFRFLIALATPFFIIFILEVFS